jgi:putative alpha-1,2-mannosidase
LKKVMLGFASVCTLLLAAVTCVSQSATDPASQVDPFICTALNAIQDNGNTLPGAGRPFGMLYWSPDNVQGTLYRRGDGNTRGFSLTHLSGPGCGVYGDVPILPIPGIPDLPQSWHPAPYRASYNPDSQKAEPGSPAPIFPSRSLLPPQAIRRTRVG